MKLQAHVRGFITRLKFAAKLKALKEKRLASKREFIARTTSALVDFPENNDEKRSVEPALEIGLSRLLSI